MRFLLRPDNGCCHDFKRARNCDNLFNGAVCSSLTVWCGGDFGYDVASFSVVENCQTTTRESLFSANSVGFWIEV